ncbi:hypothetical protein K7432_001948 [Basidiobolus ranarum]|uniref:Uncharacterized protein n=1 Tax=Basidiobolus ranarum TaxID=34480 RepID=A0ABR2X287_9FUNG
MNEDITEDELGILYTNQKAISHTLDTQLSEVKPHATITIEIPKRPVGLENYENNELVISSRNKAPNPTIEEISTKSANTKNDTKNLHTTVEIEIGNVNVAGDSRSCEVPDTTTPENPGHSTTPTTAEIEIAKMAGDGILYEAPNTNKPERPNHLTTPTTVEVEIGNTKVINDNMPTETPYTTRSESSNHSTAPNTTEIEIGNVKVAGDSIPYEEPETATPESPNHSATPTTLEVEVGNTTIVGNNIPPEKPDTTRSECPNHSAAPTTAEIEIGNVKVAGDSIPYEEPNITTPERLNRSTAHTTVEVEIGNAKVVGNNISPEKHDKTKLESSTRSTAIGDISLTVDDKLENSTNDLSFGEPLPSLPADIPQPRTDVQIWISPKCVENEEDSKLETTMINPIQRQTEDSQTSDDSHNNSNTLPNELISESLLVVNNEAQNIAQHEEKETSNSFDESSNMYTKYPLRKRTALSLHPYTRFSWTDPETMPNVIIDTSVLEEPIEPEDKNKQHDYYDSEGDTDYTETQTRRFANSLGKDDDLGLIPEASELQALLDDTTESNSHSRSSSHHKVQYKRKKRSKSLIVKLILPGYRRNPIQTDELSSAYGGKSFQDVDDFSETLARADEYLQALGQSEPHDVISSPRAKLGGRLVILDDEDEADTMNNQRPTGHRAIIAEPEDPETIESIHQFSRQSKHPSKLTKKNLAGKLPASFLRVYNVDNSCLQDQTTVQSKKIRQLPLQSHPLRMTEQRDSIENGRPLSPTSVFSDEMSTNSDGEIHSSIESEGDSLDVEAIQQKRYKQKRASSGVNRKQKPINFLDIYELLLDEYKDGEIPNFLRIACRRLLQKHNWGYDISDDPWSKMISFDPSFIDDDAYQEDQYTLSEWQQGGDFWRRKLRRLRRQRNALKKRVVKPYIADPKKPPTDQTLNDHNDAVEQTHNTNHSVRKRKRPSRMAIANSDDPTNPFEEIDNEDVVEHSLETSDQLIEQLVPTTPQENIAPPGKRKRVVKSKSKSKLQQKLDDATAQGFVSTVNACKKLKENGAKRKKVAAFVKALRKRQSTKDGNTFTSLDVARNVPSISSELSLSPSRLNSLHRSTGLTHTPKSSQRSAEPFYRRPVRPLLPPNTPMLNHDMSMSFKGKRQRLETIIGKIKRLSLNTTSVDNTQSLSSQLHHNLTASQNAPRNMQFTPTKMANPPARLSLLFTPKSSSSLPSTSTQMVDENLSISGTAEKLPTTSKRKRKGIAHRLSRPQGFDEKTTTTSKVSHFQALDVANDTPSSTQALHTKLNSWYMQNNPSRFTPKPLISGLWFNQNTFVGRGELHTLLQTLDSINSTKPYAARVFEVFDADIMTTATITEFARIIPPFISQFSDHLNRIWDLEKSNQKAISLESEMSVIRSANSLLDFITVFLHDRLSLASVEDKHIVYNVLGAECTYLLKRIDFLVREEWPDTSSLYWSLKTIGETYLHLICWGFYLNLNHSQLKDSTYPCFNLVDISKRLIKFLRKFKLDEFKVDSNDQGCNSWGASMFICLIHILDRLSQYTKSQEDCDESTLTTAPFWSVFNEAVLEDLTATTLDSQEWDFPPLADKGEEIWNMLFSILPLYQFNENGVFCTQRKCLSNWSLVQYLLEKTSGLLELSEKSCIPQFSHRQSRMLDHYIRSLFGRCYELCSMWQWDPDQKVLLLLYRFYEKRQFKDLSSESHPHFPHFLKEFSGLVPREVQFSDTCFHILMKFIYVSLNTWCERAVSFTANLMQEKSKREVRSFVSRISPTRVLKFTKSQTTADYSPLLNHYNLMLIFALTIPSSIKPRSTVQMKSYLNFVESDQMSRKIYIEGFTLLGLIYQYRREKILPILEVLNERMSQVTQEYLDMEDKRAIPYIPSIFGERPSDEWLSENDRMKLTHTQASVVELLELFFNQYRRLAAGEDYLITEFISTAWSIMLNPSLKFAHKIRMSCINHVNNLLKIRSQLRSVFTTGSSTIDSTNRLSSESDGRKVVHESPDDFDDFEFDDLDLDQLYFVEQQAVKTENFKTYDQPFAMALDRITTNIRELVFSKYIIDLNGTGIDEKYALHFSGIQKTVECWVDCLSISVEYGLKTWDTYFLSQSVDSWTTLNNPSGRRVISLFFSTKWLSLYKDITKYQDQIINVWFQTIVEPNFTVQHIMTSALLNQAVVPKIFYNLPIAINPKHHEHTLSKAELVRLRSAVIGAVLSNMGDDYSFNLSTNPELCSALKKRYHCYLKSMLSSLKDYFEYLNSPSLFNEKENYIKLIHDIVGNVIEHCSAIMYQSDSFSTQLPEIRYFMSKDFPLPPANHFYITQRLRGFSKLNYTADQRLQKSLVEFFQTHLETIFGQYEREKQDEQKLQALVASFLNTSKQSDNETIWNSTVASFRMFIFGTIIKRYVTCFIRRPELATLAIPAMRLLSMILDSLSDEYWSLHDPVQGITALQKEMSILFYPLTNALIQCQTDSHTNSVVHRIISRLILKIFISCIKIFRRVHIDYRHFYAHNKEWASLLEQTIKIAHLKSVLMIRDILPKSNRQTTFFQGYQDTLSTEHINITELSMLAPNRYFSFERQFPCTLMTRQIGECYSTRSLDDVSHELLATIFEFWSESASFYPKLRASIISDFSNIKIHNIFKFIENSRISNPHFKRFLEDLRPASTPYLVRFWSSHRHPNSSPVSLDLVNI